MPPTEDLVSYRKLTTSNEVIDRASVLMPIQIAFMTTSQALIILAGLECLLLPRFPSSFPTIAP